MSQDLSFWRKVVYIGVIVLLLFPLFWIGQPATRHQRRRRARPLAPTTTCRRRNWAKSIRRASP